MSHLDEGTLHALLDGELELAEVHEIQLHLGTCAACGSRLQDVKQFLAEADRLVGRLQMPAGVIPAAIPNEPPPVDPPHASFREPPPWGEPPPPLLLPESIEGIERRRRRMRMFRWAAMILVLVGAGRLLSSMLRPSRPELQLNERDLTSAKPATPPAVVSPQETGKPESSTTAAVAKLPRRTLAKRTPVTQPATEPKALANAPVSDSAAQNGIALQTVKDSAPADQQLAAVARNDSNPQPSSSAEDENTRKAAAAALAELDRERLRARANAATAALPPPQPEVAPAAEAPPPPRTLEQRAQVYLRIGLDEASKQLGRPLHVIEAMTPEFIGLTQGRLVSGADPLRPVVRVVYLDNRGRLILLDQQRMRTGQAPGAPSGSLRWTLGDVMLYLHGEPSTEVLRGIQRRVR